MGTTTSDTTYTRDSDSSWITLQASLWDRKNRQLDQSMALLKRVDWFLNWLVTTESEANTGWIYNEWLRGDPPCTGTQYRKLIEEISPTFKEGVTTTT